MFAVRQELRGMFDMTGLFSQGRQPPKFIVVQFARGNLRWSPTTSISKMGPRQKRLGSDLVFAVDRKYPQAALFEMPMPGRFAMPLDKSIREYHLMTLLLPGQPRSKALRVTCPPVFTPLLERHCQIIGKHFNWVSPKCCLPTLLCR